VDWSYEVKEIRYTTEIIRKHAADTVERLNELGKDGWEGWAALPYDDANVIYFLKREVIVIKSMEGTQ